MSDKITAGHVHMSGCTGCEVAIADNYAGLLTLLDKYVDWVYDLTLADVRHIPEMDVAAALALQLQGDEPMLLDPEPERPAPRFVDHERAPREQRGGRREPRRP
ncbi:MAG TPA: hypothetical protein PLI31_03040 [Methanoregulaceae archaeon]|nr:hypothetical protein [Methanoregulaceae archaeon]